MASELQAAFAKPFAEQSEFFQRKLSLPSARWDDILKQQHDHAFIVAGAMKADLLADLRGAVAQAIDQGKSIQWFRGEFDRIVRKHGWEGWTGSDSPAGVAWRTRIIYTTNLRTSHAAGRYAQMNDPDVLKYQPYVVYRHRSTENPRLDHRAWDGLVLRHDDPWLDAHRPPNGFGCKCRIYPVSRAELKRMGKSAPDSAPQDGTYEHLNRATGEVHVLPKGVQYGWDYSPGQSAAAVQALAARQNRLEGLEAEVARLNVQALVGSALFARFFAGQLAGEFPVAVLGEADRALLGAQSQVVMLSQESLAAHVVSHPEITLADYRKIQRLLDEGEVYRQGEERLVYLTLDGVLYRAVLKRTADGRKNYFLSLFRNEKGAKPKPDARIR